MAEMLRVESRTVVHIDYETILQQAVENERWRLLRAMTEAIDAIPTTQQKRYDGFNADTGPRRPGEVLADVRAAIKRLSDEVA